jgi:hypothetical protein
LSEKITTGACINDTVTQTGFTIWDLLGESFRLFSPFLCDASLLRHGETQLASGFSSPSFESLSAHLPEKERKDGRDDNRDDRDSPHRAPETCQKELDLSEGHQIDKHLAHLQEKGDIRTCVSLQERSSDFEREDAPEL